jgi:Ca2+-binding RTX toxin-like protein
VNVNLLTGLGAGSDAQGDILGGIENIVGSAFNDTLTGDGGTNALVGGAGADTLIGGPGIDTADYSTSTAAVSVNLLTGVGSGGDAQGDILTGIENIVGSDHADTLTVDFNGDGMSDIFGKAATARQRYLADERLQRDVVRSRRLVQSGHGLAYHRLDRATHY